MYFACLVSVRYDMRTKKRLSIDRFVCEVRTEAEETVVQGHIMLL
jgi:hypothetical protein